MGDLDERVERQGAVPIRHRMNGSPPTHNLVPLWAWVILVSGVVAALGYAMFLVVSDQHTNAPAKEMAGSAPQEDAQAKNLFIETHYGNGVYYFSARPDGTIYFDNAPSVIGIALADFSGKNPGLQIESISPLFDGSWIKGYFVITSKKETR